jgi:hypothetical protein
MKHLLQQQAAHSHSVLQALQQSWHRRKSAELDQKE